MAVLHEATGTGAYSQTNFVYSVTRSWSHTTSGGPNCLVIAFTRVGESSNQNTDNLTRSVSYGGTAMTSIGYGLCNGQFGETLELFYLFNPPSGTSTVTYTVTSSTGVNFFAGGNTVSYQGVKSIDPVGNFTYGSSTGYTFPVGQTQTDGKVVLASNTNGTPTVTPASGITSRYNSPPIFIGDASPTESITTVGVSYSSSVQWVQGTMTLYPHASFFSMF